MIQDNRTQEAGLLYLRFTDLRFLDLKHLRQLSEAEGRCFFYDFMIKD